MCFLLLESSSSAYGENQSVDAVIGRGGQIVGGS